MINIKFDDRNLAEKLEAFVESGGAVEDVVRDVANKTYELAIQLTPTDSWYSKYQYPERKQHEPGYLRQHWRPPTFARTGTGYEATVVNDAHYAAAVNYGHEAIPGQYIPPLPGRVTVDWVDGIFLTDKVESMMTTEYGNLFSERYGAYLERALK